jgi:elongation factor Ts
MADITGAMVKELRELTGAGILDCKKALQECDADVDKAKDYLRKRGVAVAGKKAARATNQGAVGSYIHMGGTVGVLVELSCETDFVAKNESFQSLLRDVAMHIAATNPLCVSRDEVPAEVLEKEKEIFREMAVKEGKPENILDKIVDGRVEKFYGERCLLDQKFVKDDSKSVGDVITEAIAKIGENIQIKRFMRFEVGQE